MKKRILSVVLALALCLGLVPASFAAGENPAVSSNKNAQDYSTYGKTVKSYLYENQSGGLTRVEYINGQVVVEDYDSSFQLQSSRPVNAELPVWGGFFAGEQYNFLIFGQNNTSESTSAEVIRVVKYDRNWNRLGQASIRGAYTREPFEAGSVRCAESDGYLYIHSARKMVKNLMTMYGPMSDGNNHQANLMLEVRESDMTLVDSYDQVWNLDFGYVSHDFNQFVLIDQDKNIVTLNHSDSDNSAGGKRNYGYAQEVKARGAVLIRYDEKAGQDHFQGSNRWQWCEYSLVQGFGGSSGNNATGASLGGFEETSSGYVSAYNYDGSGGSGERNVYLGYTSKSGLKSTAGKVSTSAGTTTPVLASTGLNGGYIMWNGKSGYKVNDTLYYASYDAGGKTGAVKTAQASLSDCQPISYNGKLVWYVTDNSAPVFYTLDASGVSRTGGNAAGPAPVPSANPDPAASKDPAPVTSKDPAPAASKEPDPVPGANPGTNPSVFSDVPAGHWAYSYIKECAEKGIVKGVGGNRFDPEGKVTRAEFCMMIARAFYPGELAKWESQAGGRPWYWGAMSALYSSGLDPVSNPAGAYQSDWKNVANVKLDRYEMTRIMWNLLPWTADRMNTYYSSASGQLSDWSSLAENYRQPVAVCVHFGVITGTDGSRFAGSSDMTRAQACTVLCRLNSAGASASAGHGAAKELTLTMEPKSLSLTAGETGAVRAAVSGTDSRPSVTYTTSSAGVASVSADGVVTANGAGTAVITASVTDQGRTYTAASTVTVKAAAGPDPVSSSAPETESPFQTGQLYFPQLEVISAGSERLLTAYVVGEDGGLRSVTEEVTWTNHTPQMLTMRESGGSSIARFGDAAGTARLTANWRGQTREMTFQVVDQRDEINLSRPWTSLLVGESSSTELYVFNWSKFYGQDYTVSWSAEDSSLISITETTLNGNPAVRFTAQKAGEARITCRVTMADGSTAVDYCFVYIHH